MKKLLVIAIAATALVGCEPVAESTSAPKGSIKSMSYGWAQGKEWTKVTIEGHEYISASGIRCISVVHSESCPCRNADMVRYKKTVVDGKTRLVPEYGRGTAGIPLTE